MKHILILAIASLRSPLRGNLRLAVALCLALHSSFGILHSQVPNLVSYQGRVAVGTTNFDGTGNFRFALVNTNGSIFYWSNAPDVSPPNGIPDSAVNITVTKGLYAVVLGDTSINNMAAIPMSVWTNPDVRLRVWFNDGTNGNQLLTPDQRITPNGYLPEGSVSSAALGTGAVTNTKIASQAVDSAQLAPNAVTTAKIANNAVTSTQLAAGAVTSGKLASSVGLWSVSGGNVYRPTGNVAIGSDGAEAYLTPLFVTSTSGYGIGHKEGTQWFSTYLDSAGAYLGTLSADPLHFYVNNNVNPSMTVSTNGDIGIGTSSPGTKFTVQTPISNYGITHTDGTVVLSTYVDASGAWLGTHSDHPLRFFANDGYQQLTLLQNGNVGIGYDSPNAKLSVDGGIWASGEVTCVAVNITSDRNAKEQFKPVNSREVLDKVIGMPITEWQYKTQDDALHIGPMAQDFRAAFALGHDEKHITSVDADGVALAAIQGLNEKLDEKAREVEALKKSVAELREIVTKLASQKIGGAQ